MKEERLLKLTKTNKLVSIDADGQVAGQIKVKTANGDITDLKTVNPDTLVKALDRMQENNEVLKERTDYLRDVDNRQNSAIRYLARGNRRLVTAGLLGTGVGFIFLGIHWIHEKRLKRLERKMMDAEFDISYMKHKNEEDA